MSQSLEVLLVEPEEFTANSVRQALESRSHKVMVCRSPEEAAMQPDPDVLVTNIHLGENSGLDLLSSLRSRGSKTRTVAITDLPTFEICQQALRLGASEVLAKPFRIEELISAVEGKELPSLHQPTLAPFHTVAHENAPQVIGRKIAAFALECGVALATRARISSACVEIADNVLQHAYGKTEGSFMTQAWFEDSTMLVKITDKGVGFDVLSGGLIESKSTLDGGLARVSALIEGLEVQSSPGLGTQVTLRVHAVSTRFDNDDADLSDVDFLLPGDACRMLRQLGEPQGIEASQLPAHLAICVGRLLSGPDPKAILRTPIKS
ncbi:MAG TPA: response regulator [Planctomycetes bacterium]|nr:response regulator [Planctomycetota bacterium]HIL37209.1 response regulator [Planctomycetota bacterium]